MYDRFFKCCVSVSLLCLWMVWGHLGGASDSLAQQDKLSSESAGAAPSMVMSETTFDFGEVDEEMRVVSHDFIVKNAGRAKLEIIKVSPSCGCTVVSFDREIPPGGEGKITMKLRLKGYKGNVSKSAAVRCNDPQTPSTSLTLQANVRTLIDVLPKDIVLFKGAANKVSEKIIEVVGVSQTFHVTKVDTNLEGKISVQLETVEDGKQYRLKLTNLLKQGNYAGFVRLHTDLARKSDIMIHVDGFINDET